MEKGIQPIRGREDPIALIGFIETVVIYWQTIYKSLFTSYIRNKLIIQKYIFISNFIIVNITQKIINKCNM